MFYVLKIPPTNVINAAGHFRQTRWRAIIEAIICVFVGASCAMLIGQEGVLIGTLVALMWRCIDTFLYSNKYILHCSHRRFAIRISYTVLNVILFAILSPKIWEHLVVDSYAKWILYASVTSIVEIFILAIEIILIENKTLKEILIYLKKRKKA